MKEILFLMAFVAAVFIAHKTVPTYDQHILYIGDRLMSKTSANSFSELGLNLFGTGINVLEYTSCKTSSVFQLELVSSCYYNDGKTSLKTIGIFGKIFIF